MSKNIKNNNPLLEALVDDNILQSFNKFKERFRPVRHLGKGAFGSVFEVIDSLDNTPKALKIVIHIKFKYQMSIVKEQ